MEAGAQSRDSAVELVGPWRSTESITELSLTADFVWTQRVLADVPDEPRRFDDTWHVRLFLVEGPSPDLQRRLCDSYLRVPESLFQLYAGETVSLAQKWLRDDSLFFAKWLREEQQTKETWEIEKKIEAGWPYDISSFEDPKSSRLNHTHYSRSSSPYRIYQPLDESGSVVAQAARECVSMWFAQTGQDQVVGS